MLPICWSRLLTIIYSFEVKFQVCSSLSVWTFTFIKLVGLLKDYFYLSLVFVDVDVPTLLNAIWLSSYDNDLKLGFLTNFGKYAYLAHSIIPYVFVPWLIRLITWVLFPFYSGKRLLALIPNSGMTQLNTGVLIDLRLTIFKAGCPI